jgi:AcrR family transcriptional regulator
VPKPSVELERREQILTATCKVLVSRGLNQLRIADVAAEANLSSGIVHYYFSGKDDLIHRTFEQSFEESLRRRERIFESTLPPAERLVALIDSYIPRDPETIQAWHVWLQLWAGALKDPSLRVINEKAYSKWRNLIANVILEAHKDGALHSEDPEGAADQLVALIDGLAVQVLLDSSTINADTMADICRQFLKETLSYQQ